MRWNVERCDKKIICNIKHVYRYIYKHKSIGGRNTYHDCAGLQDALHVLREVRRILWGSCAGDVLGVR